jgi:putative ABC transport system ATP-binding protein
VVAILASRHVLRTEREGQGPDAAAGNVDLASGDSVKEQLSRLHLQGTAICVVTHDSRYAAQAKRTVAMLDGRVVG